MLKLPIEIKNEIYELVCGGQLLHVSHYWPDNELKFDVEICQAALSEQAAEDLFHAETNDVWFAGAVENRHRACFAGKRHPEKISTSLLATCRQVYTEARHIPYSTNTFGFWATSTLDEFTNYTKKLGHGHHLEIRRVHLDVKVRKSDDERRWKAAIAQYLIPRLPAVHRISINLDQSYATGVMGCRTPSEFENRHLSGNYLMSALLEIRKLSLNRATVVISDAGIIFGRRMDTDSVLIQYRWTLAEKQVWARYIKDSILQTDKGREG